MASKELESLFSSTMDGIRTMVDVNTIIGNPVETPDGTVIIPVSKVSFGFGMGGWDQSSSIESSKLAGGSGGGVTVSPVGFLVITGGSVKMISVDTATPFEKIIDAMPDVIKSIGSLFGKGNE